MHLDDFYPTPPALIDRMLSGLGSLDKHGAILEPSAGKGDICDRLFSRLQAQRWGHKHTQREIDVIEIDPNLAHILRGKGYNLIHDDFLTFETHKRYGLIVANFPFSNGDEHLAKALRLIERGGTLVALVNAETIRNPYTQLRRVVAATLDEHGAAIDYVAGAFVDAERQTDVEVALIRVDVPVPKRASVILNGLKRAEPVTTAATGTTALAETDTARSLIARFNLECQAGIRLIDEYRALTPLMLRDLPKPGKDKQYNSAIIELKVNGGNAYTSDDANSYVREVRRKYWATLLADERISAVYTSNVLDDLHNRLDELRDVDFSEYNIRQLYADLQRSVSAGVESAIIDMFDEFTRKYAWADYSANIHYYNGWKTNKAYRVNRKIILPMNGFSSYGSKERLDSHYITRRLADMVKAFNYLAGDLHSVNGLASRAVEMANHAGSFRNVDFHYFTATFYKKGTCHITFTDQRLLDKFNIYGSQRKGWLPPSYGRSRYDDMTTEEREVVDEFQGEAAYAAVLRDAAYFLAEPDQLMLTA